MTFETQQAYSEVLAVLQNMPHEYVKKIPEKLINLFEKAKLDNYKVSIDKNNPIDKSKLSRKTMIILSMLNYQYWCPNKKAKDNLYRIYLANNEKYQRAIKEKYNVDDMFKNMQKPIKNDYVKENTVAMVKYKESFFTKLLNKIKRYFKNTK